MALGIVSALFLFAWHMQPMSGIGISGEPGGGGGEGWAAFASSLRARFAIAAFGVVAIQLVCCFALQSLLGSGEGK